MILHGHDASYVVIVMPEISASMDTGAEANLSWMPGPCHRRRTILTMNLKRCKVIHLVPGGIKGKSRIRTGKVAGFIPGNSALKVFINTRAAWD